MLNKLVKPEGSGGDENSLYQVGTQSVLGGPADPVNTYFPLFRRTADYLLQNIKQQCFLRKNKCRQRRALRGCGTRASGLRDVPTLTHAMSLQSMVKAQPCDVCKSVSVFTVPHHHSYNSQQSE